MTVRWKHYFRWQSGVREMTEARAIIGTLWVATIRRELDREGDFWSWNDADFVRLDDAKEAVIAALNGGRK